MPAPSRILYLCGGTQSSGSTLASWCFLQRADMDGYLDADNDILPEIPGDLGKPLVWYKTTISSFRLSELIEHYRDEGWDVRPLLVVRDVRFVWASLFRKPYGLNGITAEDPPLRTRLRRFKADWELFQYEKWPMIRYESFITEPEQVLRWVCTELSLPWDRGMMTWPKDRNRVASTKHGNQTFRETRGAGLLESIKPASEELRAGAIPPADLEWLEDQFHEFNLANDYPTHIRLSGTAIDGTIRAIPSFEMTRRHKWEIRRKPIRWFLHSLGFRRQSHNLQTSK
jgi:hypothetical protein